METRTVGNLLCFAIVVVVTTTCAPACLSQTTGNQTKSTGPAKSTRKAADQGPGADAPAPGPPPGVFGQVVAVRGNVLQMSTMEGKGLTRVILASSAQIIKDEKLKPDALKTGMKVTATGRQVDGTGMASVPLKVEVHTLEPAGGMSNMFAFFGGGSSPLMRGRDAQLFRKVNYSGNIEFDATVQSVDPLVLTDERGKPLPIVIAADLEIHRRAPRQVKEGDITAGMRLMSMGERTPDGLLKANMIIVMGVGSDRGTMPGTIMAVSPKGVTLRPRFEPRDLTIELAPTAKIYTLESLDLDTISVGDTLIFTGKVIGGTAAAPTALVVRTITPAEGESPQIEDDGGGFFGNNRSVTASVKGTVVGFDPLRVQTPDGHEVTVTVPGQISYVRYRLQERSDLKAGQKALFSGRNRPGGLQADLVILNPPLSMGPGF